MNQLGMDDKTQESSHGREREQRAEVAGDRGDSKPPVMIRTSWIGPVEER